MIFSPLSAFPTSYFYKEDKDVDYLTDRDVFKPGKHSESEAHFLVIGLRGDLLLPRVFDSSSSLSCIIKQFSSFNYILNSKSRVIVICGF